MRFERERIKFQSTVRRERKRIDQMYKLIKIHSDMFGLVQLQPQLPISALQSFTFTSMSPSTLQRSTSTSMSSSTLQPSTCSLQRCLGNLARPHPRLLQIFNRPWLSLQRCRDNLPRPHLCLQRRPFNLPRLS